MKFTLDENLGNRGAELLRRAGHQVALPNIEGADGAKIDSNLPPSWRTVFSTGY